MRSLRLAFRKRMLTPTPRASVVEAHWCRREWPTRTGLAFSRSSSAIPSLYEREIV